MSRRCYLKWGVMINRLGTIFHFTKVRSHGGISRYKIEGKNVIKEPPRRHRDKANEEAAIYNGCSYAPDLLSSGIQACYPI